MKQDDHKNKYLGSQNIFWAQWLVLSIGVLFAAACTLYYLVSDNINYLHVALLTVIMWGGLCWLYSRLREVRMFGDKFIIRNLFGRIEIDHQDYEGLQEGVLPVIFEIKFNGDRSYPFLLSHTTFIKGILRFSPDEMLKQLRHEVDNHFGPGSTEDINNLPKGSGSGDDQSGKSV